MQEITQIKFENKENSNVNHTNGDSILVKFNNLHWSKVNSKKREVTISNIKKKIL